MLLDYPAMNSTVNLLSTNESLNTKSRLKVQNKIYQYRFFTEETVVHKMSL